MNSKDIANSDPAEGAREVIERELKRHDNDEAAHEPEGDDKQQEREPH